MTVIVAVEDKARSVWVGCDSFLGTSRTRDLLDRPKWILRDGLLIGFAGDIRAAQIVEHATKIRARRPREGVDRYLALLADAIRRAHVEHCGAQEAVPNVDFLVAYQGRAYTIQEGYSVIRSAHGYAAIGAGAQCALGSLASTEGASAEDRVGLALAAAIRHDPHVSGPVYTHCAR